MKSRSERVHKMSPALGMFLALGQTYKKNLSVFDLGHFSEQVPLQPNLGQKYPHSKITYLIKRESPLQIVFDSPWIEFGLPIENTF